MGPKRMEYSKTVSLVKYVGKQVNKAIKELSFLKGDDENETK
jgi:transcriptional regulator of heat shock response